MFRRKFRVILSQPHTWCHISWRHHENYMKIYETVTSHVAYIRLRMDQRSARHSDQPFFDFYRGYWKIFLWSLSPRRLLESHENETFRWFEKQNLFHILNITKKLRHIEYIDTRPLHTLWTAINFTTFSKCYSCVDNQWKHLRRQPAAIKTHQTRTFPFLFSLNENNQLLLQDSCNMYMSCSLDSHLK